MASTDGGTSWIPLCGKYTNAGNSNQDLDNPLYDNFQTEWVLEEVDLSDFVGMTDVRFKFRLISDAGVTEDGFTLMILLSIQIILMIQALMNLRKTCSAYSLIPHMMSSPCNSPIILLFHKLKFTMN